MPVSKLVTITNISPDVLTTCKFRVEEEDDEKFVKCIQTLSCRQIGKFYIPENLGDPGNLNCIIDPKN